MHVVVADAFDDDGRVADLVQALRAAARDRDERYIFLEGAPGCYTRHGFGPASEHGFLRPSDRIPGPAFQVVVLDDRGARGRMVYPDVFWQHDAVGLRGETLAQVRAAMGEQLRGGSAR